MTLLVVVDADVVEHFCLMLFFKMITLYFVWRWAMLYRYLSKVTGDQQYADFAHKIMQRLVVSDQ